MITVPLWLFTALIGVAGLALLAVPVAYLRGRRVVDDQLDRAWLRETSLPLLTPPTDRQADRGHNPKGST